MKYKLVVGAAVMILSAAFAFASGQQEHSVHIPGTVVSFTGGTGGTTTIVLSSNGKTYSVSIPDSLAARLNLQVGKQITLNGLARDDGKKESDGSDLKVASVEEDGVNHVVAFQSGRESHRSSSTDHESSAGSSHEVASHDGSSGSGTDD